MRKIKVLAMLLAFSSLPAMADYECTLKLSHTEDLYQVIAEKTLRVESGQMKSGNMGTLLIETETKRKKITLDINAVLSGWKGEEDASFVMIRRLRKKHSTNGETISEVMTVKGDDELTGWFDSYKLDIVCAVKE